MTPEEAEVLPESIRDWNEVKEAKDITSFWDGMKSMRSKIGTGLYQPSEEAGAEDWGKFSTKAVDLSKGRLMPKPDLSDPEQQKALYKSLGVPDDIKDYEFDEVEGSDYSDERKDFVRGIAKEANLTKDQLKIIDRKFREQEVVSMNGNTESFNKGLNELKADWGLPTDDRTNQARKVQRMFFPHLGDDVPLSANEIRSFYNLYKQLNTDTKDFQDQVDNAANKSGISKEDATFMIAEIRANKEHPYNNRLSPGNAAAQKQMRNLYLAKNGQSPE